MDTVVNTNNPIIAIKTHTYPIKTKFSTISSCKKLVDLIDYSTRTIESDTSYDTMDEILNVLRNNYVEKALIPIAADLKRFGMEISINGYCYVNIGGQIFFLSKKLLTTRFGYFEVFFQNYAKFDPDYSEILIDRSAKLFAKIISMISSTELLEFIDEQIKTEIDFYLYKPVNQFLNMHRIGFLAGSEKTYKKYSLKNILELTSDNIYIIESKKPTIYIKFNTDISIENISSIITSEPEYKEIGYIEPSKNIFYKENIGYYKWYDYHSGYTKIIIHDKSVISDIAVYVPGDYFKKCEFKQYIKVDLSLIQDDHINIILKKKQERERSFLVKLDYH